MVIKITTETNYVRFRFSSLARNARVRLASTAHKLFLMSDVLCFGRKRRKNTKVLFITFTQNKKKSTLYYTFKTKHANEGLKIKILFEMNNTPAWGKSTCYGSYLQSSLWFITIKVISNWRSPDAFMVRTEIIIVYYDSVIYIILDRFIYGTLPSHEN